MPTTVNLQNAERAFTENTAKIVTCKLPNAKPGKSHTVFTVKVGGVNIKTSTVSDLSNSTDDSDQAVDVTFQPMVTLQRQHNGLDMVCEATWMGSTVISSAATAVDVRCKKFIFVVSHLLFKIYVQY